MDVRKCGGCGLVVELDPGRLADAATCRCGALLPPASTTAGMLQCPFCAAPAARGAHRCDHCASHLKTLRCPACFALEFVGSRHCASCGGGLEALTSAEALALSCPRCRVPLLGQAMAGTAVASCADCGGLWLDHATFSKVRREREETAAGLPPRTGARPASSAGPEPYLRCPACAGLMNRSNFGRLSGVLLDTCRAHGLWFDAEELQQVLDFIARGGLELASMRDAERERERVRSEKFDARLESQRTVRELHPDGPGLSRTGSPLVLLLKVLFG